MRLQLMVTLAMCFVISQSAVSEEVGVQSLSNGACWFDTTEEIKLVSFNDKTQLKTSRENLDSQISTLLNGVSAKANYNQDDILIHCGAYGASIVVKTHVNGAKTCAWLKIDKGLLAVRSLGGLEETKSESCDGYVWGELIIGLKDPKQVDELRRNFSESFIESVTAINNHVVKIMLKKTFHGKEASVMEELKKNMDLKYVELNFYQHPVGEFGIFR